MKEWTKMIPEEGITNGITQDIVKFAQEFGHYLATDDQYDDNGNLIVPWKKFNEYKKNGDPVVAIDKKVQKKPKTINKQLTSTQLRRFLGEIKRQQIKGYNESRFILLKPKLAYAVGRAQNGKIKDLYEVLSKAIDVVVDAEEKNRKALNGKPSDPELSPFKNFIAIFEAIVAYHKEIEKEK